LNQKSVLIIQKAKMAESDQNALKVHFGNDDEALQKQRNASNE
jgi:hypothetical protein